MADLKKTVEIIFGAKNEVSKVVTDIGRQFDSLGDLASNVTAPFAKIGDSILKIDAGLAALAIGGMAVAINKAGKFGDSFREVSTLIDASSGDIEKFRNDILVYATDSDRSLADINQSVYKAISAGIDYREVLKTLKVAEELAQAGRNDLASTTVLLAGTMNAYGAKTEEAGRYADIFMQTVRKGLTTLPELAGSLANVTGIASMGKVPIETLSAAIAALTATGIPTEQAITGIKNVIANIIKPTSEAEKMAAQLGISFSAQALAAGGLEKVLWDAWRATKGNAEEMNTLFGSIRGLNAATVLASDSGGKFKTILNDMAGAAGTLGTASAKMTLQFEDMNQKILNNIDVVLIGIGDKLMPGYGKIAGAFGDLLKGVKIGVDAGAFDPLFAYLDQVSAAIAVWLKAVGVAFPEALTKIDFTSLIAAFGDLGRAIGDYFGGLDLTKADDLASAMQLLIDIVAGIIRVTAGMADAFRPFATVIVDFFKTLAAGGPETQETMGKILAFSMAIQAAGLGVVAAIMAIDEFKISVRGLFDVLAGGSQFAWNAMQILFDLTMRGFLKLEEQFVSVIDTMTFGMFPGLEALKVKIIQQTEDVTKSILKNNEEGSQGLSLLADGFIRLGNETGSTKTKTDELRKGLLDLPAVTAPEIRLTGGAESKKTVADIKKTLEEIPGTQVIQLLVDGSTIEKSHNLIMQTFPDGQVLYTNVGVETDAVNLDGVAKKIEKAVPKKKKVDVELKMEMEKIKEKSDIIQKSIEWKAKVDIAQIESAAKTIEAVFKNADTRITSTGSVIEKILGEIGNKDLDWSIKSDLEDLLKKESDARKIAMEQSQILTAQQIALNKLKLAVLERGDSMIKISADGLKPHLEMILWEILEAIQIRANASGSEFLLGIK
jgi:TP901 family phage tail tape measure protein